MKKFLKWLLIFAIIIVIIDVIVGPRPTTTPETKKVGEVSQKATVAPKVEYKIGDIVSLDGYNVSANSVSRKSACGYSKPNTGNEFLYVNITLVNSSDEDQNYNPLDFKVEDLNGNRKERDCIQDENYLDSGDLAPGGKVTGTLVFQLPKGSSAKLIFEPNTFTEHKAIINL